MEVIDLDEVFKTANHDKDNSKKTASNMNNKSYDSRKAVSDRNNKSYDSKKTVSNKSIITEIARYAFGVVVVVACAFFIVTFIGQRTEVNGSSMESTMSDKDNLIVDKITYRFSSPERFDIVVFPHVGSDNKEVYYIKRIIGLPGETVQISNGTIYINDVPLEENYGREVIKDAKLAASPVKLNENEYFVLGDNRNYSSDSREFGAVSGDIIVGRAVFRIYPFKKFGKLK